MEEVEVVHAEVGITQHSNSIIGIATVEGNYWKEMMRNA
jgi:hypothetical protein